MITILKVNVFTERKCTPGCEIRTARSDQLEISLLLPRSISSRQLQEAEKLTGRYLELIIMSRELFELGKVIE